MARRMSSATGAPVFSDSFWSFLSWSALRNSAALFIRLYYTTGIHILTLMHTRTEDARSAVLKLWETMWIAGGSQTAHGGITGETKPKLL
jgi:hypothetical protein